MRVPVNHEAELNNDAMAYDVSRPHDSLFRAVFSVPAEAAAFLRAYLPESVGAALRWSTVALQNTSFIDDELRNSESDLLFAIRRRSGAPAWLYVLVEHQSTPAHWMRWRLHQYCARIWERDRRRYPRARQLRPIVPLVFYHGAKPWNHATQFAELFAAAVREWPWLPHYEHVLVDRSAAGPEAVVRGQLRGRVAQLTMMAAYRDHWVLLQRATSLLATLHRQGGMDALRPIVVYVLATQKTPTRRRFVAELARQVPGPGGDAMNYVEQLIHERQQDAERKGHEEGREAGREEGRQEGRQEGRLQGQVATIEGLLDAGVQLSVIESADGIDEYALELVRRKRRPPDAGRP